MSDNRGGSPALSIEHLRITLPDGRRLFDDASLEVDPGEFVLLVGPSGSGKTTLLRLIAGLDDPEETGLSVTGRIDVATEHGSSNAPTRVGLVFQNHALFDELSPVGNVRFAIDHRPGPRQAGREEARKLLQDLRVPVGGKLSTLSGGERQRVAVARTLAMDPPVLLFDEPTSGLDPGRARAVADLIAETHQRCAKTVMVVTHDFTPYLKHKPRIILLDATTGRLRGVEEAELPAYFDTCDAEERVTSVGADAAPMPRIPAWMKWLEEPGLFVLTLLASIVAPFANWRRPRWRLRYLWHYMRMVVFGTTAIYVAIAGAMLGFVFISFSFSQLPYTEVTVPLLTEEFLAATGYSTFRVIVPLLIAVLMAGKCGASVAADVGARRLTHQYDAMRNCGVRPEHYLYGNIVPALFIGGPILTAIAYLANCYASLVAFLMTSEEGTVALFGRNFFATVWPDTQLLPTGTGWVTLKMTTSGILVAALAYAIGSRPKESSADVSRDVGLTIFWASLAVLMLHALYSHVEF
jgi:ABC-type lipoprotein export system ATPase subunit/ABC-type transporter Mla maintaining outer membrane lipid asymmetry permease subunit MlaE